MEVMIEQAITYTAYAAMVFLALIVFFLLPMVLNECSDNPSKTFTRIIIRWWLALTALTVASAAA